MTKREAAYKISQAANVYKSQIQSQNLLIIYGDPNRPSWISTKADAKNFYHLTGVTINKANILKDYDGRETNELVVFYEKALRNKLTEDDFDFKNEHTVQKLNVIVQTLNINSNASMLGDYDGWRINLKSNKLAGGKDSFLGLIKDGDYYVPNTIMADDIRKNSPSIERVLAILSKKITDKKYNTIRKIAKKIDLLSLLDKIKGKVPIDEKMFGWSGDNLSAPNINKISYTPISYNSGAAVLSPNAPSIDIRSLFDKMKNSIVGAIRKKDKQQYEKKGDEIQALEKQLSKKDEQIIKKDEEIAKKDHQIAALIKAAESFKAENEEWKNAYKSQKNKIEQTNLWFNANPDVKARIIKDKKEHTSVFAANPSESSDTSISTPKQIHKPKNKKGSL